jgi:hypothetical protein
VILVIPLLAYVYFLFPEVKEVKVFNYTFTSNYYEDIQVFIWVLSQKLIFVITFLLWYLTCKHWWKNILLVPLVFFVSQLIVVINDDYHIIDEHEIFFSIVISIPIVYGFYMLIKKIKSLIASKRMNNDLEYEIEDLIKELSTQNKNHYVSLKQRLEALRTSKPSLDKKHYLKELLKLKDQFSA